MSRYSLKSPSGCLPEWYHFCIFKAIRLLQPRHCHRHRTPSKEGTVVEKKESKLFERQVAEGWLDYVFQSAPCVGKRRIQTTSFSYNKQNNALEEKLSRYGK